MDNNIDNINSGADYAQIIIDSITKNENLLPIEQQLPINLLTYWCEEIKSYAEITYYEYLIGKRDYFSFDEDEFKGLFEKAGMRYAEDLLNGLIDKDLVDVLVREDGEIIYRTNDKGNQMLDDYNEQRKE